MKAYRCAVSPSALGLIVVVTAFTVSRACWDRILYFRPLDGTFFEFVDPPLLVRHLWQSLFYLHSEPPGFNLFLGLVLILFPGRDTEAFFFLYTGMGLIICTSLYWLIADLTDSILLSAVLTILFMMSPATILYEHFLYNTYPAAMLLCVSALCLERFLRRGSRLFGATFLLAIDLLVLMHSTFQILWLLVPLGMMYWFARERFGEIRSFTLIAVGVVIVLYLKNVFVFGTVTTSSWLGFHLASTTTFQIDPVERIRLVKEHKLSPFALIERYSSIDTYRSLIGPTPPTGIPVLDEKSKGNPNYNNIAVLKIERGYRRDAIWVITHHPSIWIRGFWNGYLIYLKAASDYYMLDYNRTKLEAWNTAYDWLLPECNLSGRLLPLTFVVGFPAIWIVSIAMISLIYWRERGLGELEIVMFFMLFTVLYVTVVSNALEVSENQRFRYVVDPFYLALFAMIASQFRPSRRMKWTRNRENHLAGDNLLRSVRASDPTH